MSTQAENEALMLEMLEQEWEGRLAMKRFEARHARGEGIGLIRWPKDKPSVTVSKYTRYVTADGEVVDCIESLPKELQDLEAADEEQVRRIMEYVRVHNKLPPKR